MRKLPPLLLVLVLGLLSVAGSADAKSKKSKPKTRYYLALGDSLAWGYQLDATGGIVKSRGYAKRVRASARKQRRYRKLKLVNLGCPGENLATFADGGCIGQLLADPAQQRSQMDEALAWLERHRKRRRSSRSASAATSSRPARAPAASTSTAHSPGCSGSRRTSADRPGAAQGGRRKKVKIAIQTQYNPFLALVLKGGAYADLGLASVELGRQANVAIRNAVFSSKFKIADVQAAFKATDTTTMVPFGAA